MKNYGYIQQIAKTEEIGSMYQIRTDLALETQEKMQEDHIELKGVRFLEEKINKSLTISTVVTGV